MCKYTEKELKDLPTAKSASGEGNVVLVTKTERGKRKRKHPDREGGKEKKGSYNNSILCI